ncbi:hypothetical protein PybrP1_011310 [[Pythium] brassicae (nom. inval.)]|nr:hypothetical protein PybrP1_011310 [[Pythium] brassicae (nom. inval.)]
MRTQAAAFTALVIKPEIASGAYAFASPELEKAAGPQANAARALNSDGSSGSDAEMQSDAAPLRSSIPGVTAVEAALLYPDGQILAGVFARIAQAGLHVLEKRSVEITKSQARALFSHERERLRDEKTFRAFLDSFTRGLSLALVLELPKSLRANDAVCRCRQLLGNDNPVAARQDALSSSLSHDEWPLRALCGLDAAQSGILCSATLDCAYRERAALFPPANAHEHQPHERAVLVALPSFLKALPEGRALLLTSLSAGGVLVSTVIDGYEFASPKDLALLQQELHPTTNDQHREQFAACLREQVDCSDGASLLVEVEALDLATKLRCVLGPASLDAARLYFPDSVRAQLPAPVVSSVEHLRTAESGATCLETGLFASFDSQTTDALLRPRQRPHSPATSALASEPVERTFAIIKPGTASDGVAVQEIHAAIRAFGFAVEKQRRLCLSRAQAATFYSEHRGKAFFERLLGFMTSGELVAMQLARKNAVRTWRGLMGPTNALVARDTHPWTLRARFGIDGTRNATHGSDATSSARRELQFFFGGGLRAFAHDNDEEIGGAGPSAAFARALAQRALPPPYRSDLTLEKVLIQALDELLTFENASQHDACTWLGDWLLEYSRSQHHQRGLDQDEVPASRTVAAAAAHHSKSQTVVAADSASLLEDSKSFLVAIAFASDVTVPQRSAVGDATRSLATPRFALFDVAGAMGSSAPSKGAELASAVAALAKQIRDAGKRRVVLFDFDVSSPALVQSLSEALAWPVSYAITIRCSPPSRASVRSVLDTRVPHVHYFLQQQSTLDIGHRPGFETFFAGIFRPSLVVVRDSDKRVSVPTWRSVAQHFGVVLLVFEDLVRARVAQERDPSGPFSQLERTRAKTPRALLLSLVGDAVQRFQPTGASDDVTRGCAQCFLLCNFPISEVAPSEFEECVGQIFGLVHVPPKRDPTASDSDAAWASYLNKRGAVTELQLSTSLSELSLAQSVRDTCALSFGPIFGFCFARTGELLDRVQSLAREQGFVVLEMGAGAGAPDPLGYLKRVLFRDTGFWREKFLVCGFSASPDALRACIEDVAVPRFAIVTSDTSPSPEMQRLVAVLDEYPEIVQLDPMAPAYAPRRELEVSSLQAVLFGKRVSFAVGDSSALDANRLHSTLAPLGYCVLDLRKQQLQQVRECPSNLDVGMLVTQIRATAAPRCLVIGALEHVAFYQAVEKAVGAAAVDKIVVLRRLERQAPPSRAAKRSADEDDYSDDEEELERQRQQQIRAASPPHLDELLQVFAPKTRDPSSPETSSSNGAAAVRLAFLDLDKVYAQLRRELSPRLIGVVGHPHSFYARVVQVCSKRNAIGNLAKLQRFVAATPFATYFVDGFPRSNGAAAPSVAQQLLALGDAVAPVHLLVRFATSVDVLVERKAERKAERVTRHVLEDAQDALEAETSELLALFASSRKRGAVMSVTCERELADAEEALDDALARAGVLH